MPKTTTPELRTIDAALEEAGLGDDDGGTVPEALLAARRFENTGWFHQARSEVTDEPM